MPKLDNETILLVVAGVTALAMVVQTILLIAVFAAVRKAANAVREEVEDLRSSVMPLVYNARDLYERLAPKIEAAVGDVAEIAEGLRVQTAQLQTTALETMERLRRQTSRLDHMFTAVLDAVDRAGGFVAEAVSRPVRQMAGVLSSIKAVVESLRTTAAEPRPAHPGSQRPAGDKEMFV